MKQNLLCILLLCLFGHVNETYASRYHSEEIESLKAFLSEPSADPENGGLNWELFFEEDATSWDADNEGWGEFPGLEWSEDETNKRLTSIYFSGAEYLTGVLDVSKMEMLEELDCSRNQLSGIVLSEKQVHLMTLNCSNNLLTELALPSGLLALDFFECSHNQLTELILPEDLTLIDLSCDANQLSFRNLLELQEKVDGYFEYHSQTLTLEARPDMLIQMDQLGLYTGEGEVFYQMEDGKEYELQRIFQVPSSWKDGDEKIITMVHRILDDFGQEGAEFILTLNVKASSEHTYYSLVLSAAYGITLTDLINGIYDVKEGDNFTIDFTLTDKETTIDDILCLLDEEEVEVEEKGDGTYRLVLNQVSDDITVRLAMRHYKVTLTETEGVTLLPAAGSHSIAYGETFEFSVTLEDEYNESEPKVYANGKSLKGDLLSGVWYYLLESIAEPQEITIEGVKKNPTGNQPGVIPVTIYNIDGNLIVETPIVQSLQIYSSVGKLFVSETIVGKRTIPLSSGVYLVKVGDKVEKVIVK